MAWQWRLRDAFIVEDLKALVHVHPLSQEVLQVLQGDLVHRIAIFGIFSKGT